MSTTIHCSHCNRPLASDDPVVVSHDRSFCTDCLQPVYRLIGYKTPANPNTLHTPDQVQQQSVHEIVKTHDNDQP